MSLRWLKGWQLIVPGLKLLQFNAHRARLEILKQQWVLQMTIRHTSSFMYVFTVTKLRTVLTMCVIGWCYSTFHMYVENWEIKSYLLLFVHCLSPFGCNPKRKFPASYWHTVTISHAHSISHNLFKPEDTNPCFVLQAGIEHHSRRWVASRSTNVVESFGAAKQ